MVEKGREEVPTTESTWNLPKRQKGQKKTGSAGMQSLASTSFRRFSSFFVSFSIRLPYFYFSSFALIILHFFFLVHDKLFFVSFDIRSQIRRISPSHRHSTSNLISNALRRTSPDSHQSHLPSSATVLAGRLLALNRYPIFLLLSGPGRPHARTPNTARTEATSTEHPPESTASAANPDIFCPLTPNAE